MKRLLKRLPMSDRRFVLWGWIFFILSALAFMVTTARAGDWIGFAGATFFLIANILFLIPILRESNSE